MVKKIVFKNEDGTCGIISPAPQMFDKNSMTRQVLRDQGVDFKSDDDVLNYIAQKDVPKDLEWRITDEENLPTDHTFRNAWTDDNKTETVDVDIEKCRVIQMGRIRIMRDKKLKELDIEVSKALESQDETKLKELAKIKQDLRDITKTFDLGKAKTPDELKELIPEAVK